MSAAMALTTDQVMAQLASMTAAMTEVTKAVKMIQEKSATDSGGRSGDQAEELKEKLEQGKSVLRTRKSKAR